MAAALPLLPRSLAPTIQEALADTPSSACSVRGRAERPRWRSTWPRIARSSAWTSTTTSGRRGGSGRLRRQPAGCGDPGRGATPSTSSPPEAEDTALSGAPPAGLATQWSMFRSFPTCAQLFVEVVGRVALRLAQGVDRIHLAGTSVQRGTTTCLLESGRRRLGCPCGCLSSVPGTPHPDSTGEDVPPAVESQRQQEQVTPTLRVWARAPSLRRRAPATRRRGGRRQRRCHRYRLQHGRLPSRGSVSSRPTEAGRARRTVVRKPRLAAGAVGAPRVGGGTRSPRRPGRNHRRLRAGAGRGPRGRSTSSRAAASRQRRAGCSLRSSRSPRASPPARTKRALRGQRATPVESAGVSTRPSGQNPYLIPKFAWRGNPLPPRRPIRFRKLPRRSPVGLLKLAWFVMLKMSKNRSMVCVVLGLMR